MRMVRRGVNLELRQQLPTENALREHVLDRPLDGELRLALEQVPVALGPEAARVGAVVVVELLVELVAGELHLPGVDDHDEVTRVDVRREGRLVLATKNAGD